VIQEIRAIWRNQKSEIIMNIEIQPGQVWVDRHSRNHHRFILVTAVDGNTVTARNLNTGKLTRMNKDWMEAAAERYAIAYNSVWIRKIVRLLSLSRNQGVVVQRRQRQIR
jgi:hypothetical protein